MHHIIQFELKRLSRVVLIYSIVWGIMIFVFMTFVDALQANQKQLEELLRGLPPEFLKAFGADPESFSTLTGYYNSKVAAFLFISNNILAIFLAINTFGKEISDRTLLFLLTKPVTRRTIYLAKFVSVALVLAIINFLLFIASVIAVSILTKEPLPLNFFVLIFIASFLLNLFFQAVASLLGTLVYHTKALYLSVMAAVVAYMLSIFIAVSDSLRPFRFFTPYYYADPNYITDFEKLSLPHVAVLLVVTAILMVGGWWWINKREIDT